jgi:DNA uptake protein ComE-like DNA-binding protein
MKFFSKILDFFNIDKNDRKGLLVLISILLTVILINHWIENSKPEVSVIVYKNGEQVVEKQSDEDNLVYNNEKGSVKNTGKQLFNPNDATFNELLNVGFDKKTAYTLIHYRVKGAKFRIKNDLKKVYGLNEALYTSLVPYINLPDKLEPINYNKEKSAFSKSDEAESSNAYTPSKREKEIPFQPIEINSADTEQLITLKGVGLFYARKIIEYRTKLGGFIKKEQLLEVWGLDSDKYNVLLPQIELDKSKLTKININSVTLNQLKRHPYMSWKEANAIINYRKQHGRFNSMYDVEKIILLSDETLIKMYPYISFD